jgi:hypothetical protein
MLVLSREPFLSAKTCDKRFDSKKIVVLKWAGQKSLINLEVKEMRKLGLISAVALLVTAGNAMAFTASLSVGGNNLVVPIPLSGGNFDVRVDILRDGSPNQIVGAQMNMVTPDAANGVITINNASAALATLGTTGTRWNEAEWDANTNGTATNPNAGLAGPMSTGVPRGPYSTTYNGTWTTGDSFYGILNINLAAQPNGTIITLLPHNLLLADGEIFDDVPGLADGVSFQYVPEPASALLLIAALPFMRRRRTA